MDKNRLSLQDFQVVLWTIEGSKFISEGLLLVVDWKYQGKTSSKSLFFRRDVYCGMSFNKCCDLICPFCTWKYKHKVLHLQIFFFLQSFLAVMHGRAKCKGMVEIYALSNPLTAQTDWEGSASDQAPKNKLDLFLMLTSSDGWTLSPWPRGHTACSLCNVVKYFVQSCCCESLYIN